MVKIWQPQLFGRITLHIQTVLNQYLKLVAINAGVPGRTVLKGTVTVIVSKSGDLIMNGE